MQVSTLSSLKTKGREKRSRVRTNVNWSLGFQCGNLLRKQILRVRSLQGTVRMRRTSCGVSVTSQASLGHKGSHSGDLWRREFPPLNLSVLTTHPCSPGVSHTSLQSWLLTYYRYDLEQGPDHLPPSLISSTETCKAFVVNQITHTDLEHLQWKKMTQLCTPQQSLARHQSVLLRRLLLNCIESVYPHNWHSL